MADEGPSVYLFDGDDEFAIDESIQKIRSWLGEASIADMNITRLDGRSCNLAQIKDAAAAMPFLAPKRLIILTFPTARFKDRPQQEQLLSLLSAENPTSKFVLVQDGFLTLDKDRKRGSLNWLEKWASSPEQARRVFIKHHPMPKRGLMTQWILGYTRRIGGQITPQAAASLTDQVGGDTRLAAQEITKLLTYVNFSRPVDADDVEHLTPLTAKIGDFELLNALRDRDGRKAQALLHRSLSDDEPSSIFQTIVFQVRTLLLAREILDEHGTIDDFPRALKISEYPARLALESASRLSIDFLELIYHRLLELDEAIKTSQMEADLALELLVIELTS